MLQGSEESLELDLIDTSGDLKKVQLQLLPRVLRIKRHAGSSMNGQVVVARIRDIGPQSSSEPQSDGAAGCTARQDGCNMSNNYINPVEASPADFGAEIPCSRKSTFLVASFKSLQSRTESDC